MSFFDAITKHLFPVPVLVLVTAGLVLGVYKLGLWGGATQEARTADGIMKLKRRGRHTTAAPYEPPPAGAPVGQHGVGSEGFQSGAVPAPTAGAGPAVVIPGHTNGQLKEGFQSVCTEYTPEPERYLGPYRAGGAGVSGTNFDDVKNPTGRKFDATPLDQFYDEYEKAELDAETAAREKAAGDTVNVAEDDVPDMGALFSSTDMDITNIPWDAENRELLPSDVLWGFVSSEASKGLFLKAYSQLALSLPDAVQDLKPGDEASPPAINMPDLPTSTTDPAAQIMNDTGMGIVGAIGQKFNPLDADKVGKLADKMSDAYEGKKPLKITQSNSDIFDSADGKLKKMNTKLEKISKSKMKKGGPIKKLKHLFRKIMAKMQKKMLNMLQKFMQKKLIKAIIMRVISWGIFSANLAASIATFGAASPALAAWTIVMTILEFTLNAIDIVSMAASMLLPVILEKYLDGEGICPDGSTTIQEMIPNKTAYFFFTTFVPLADLVDLFGPYVCWDGAEPKLKIRVFEPTYLEDKTLSLSYKKWADSMETGGDIMEEGKKITSLEGYDCGDGLCREICRDGTYTTSRNDPTCHQKTLPSGVGTTRYSSCADMKTRKGATADTGLNMEWKEQAGTLNCFESYEQAGVTSCRTERSTSYNWETGGFSVVVCDGTGTRGCGCVRATRLERAYCDPGYTLDSGDMRCYSCPTGYTRSGAQCFSSEPTYQRAMQSFGEDFVKKPGYTLPEFLSGISDPVATQKRGKITIEPYTRYCNFASPVMLDRMAQFYYEQSYSNPDIIEVDFEALGDTPENRKIVDLSGGPMLVQWDYISRFYGVIASSELSCDVACEIRTITYNPITGASFKEEIGCSNIGDDPAVATDFDKANTMCYRRFYFIQGSGDPQGIFTVTGCTNSDGTAPDAEVDSWDEGIAYVPSLPKVFSQKICENDITWSAEDIGRMANAVGTAAATSAMGGAGMLLGPALQYGSSQLDARLVKDQEEAGGSYLMKDANGRFSVTTKTAYVMNNKAATALINHGPVVEQAAGVAPLVNRCRTALVMETTCAHKYNLRDTIRQYEMDNPKKRVKQVDIVEPRGVLGGANHGCYYRWKEVDYDPATNTENTNFANKEVVFKYSIQNQKTCLYEPERIIYDVKESEYPLRTFPLEGSSAYATRKKVTKPVRFIRIEGSTDPDGWLQLSQIVVYNTDYVNVAKGRVPTSATSAAYADAGGTASLATYATDGNAMARMAPTLFMSQTPGGVFEIDLGKEEYIHSVTIYNRSHPGAPPDLPPPLLDSAITNLLSAERLTFIANTMSSDTGSGDLAVQVITGAAAAARISLNDAALAWARAAGINRWRQINNPKSQLTLARRWNGYKLRCLDAARALNYEFRLTGDINGQPQLMNTFTDFPAIELQRRRPFNSFAVPLGLPAETTLGGVETKAVRYIRIDGGADFLQLSQVGVFNINNVNVARGKMPTANTTAAYVEAGQTFSASYATDGAMEARVSPRVYSSIGGNGVFEIDLGREEMLNRIVIYNRAVPDGTSRDMRLLIARRWTGYSVRCLDAARTERYKFAMQGTTGTGAAEQPNNEQNFLFSPCPTKCSDKSQIERLVDQFNTANANARIIKVLKTWTPKPNRCDFEVEMMRIGGDGKKTFAKETTFIEVSRDGNTCNFNRSADGSASLNSGTYIQANTPDLKFDLGGGFGSKGLGVYEAVTATVKGVFGTMAQTLQQKKPLDVLKQEAVKTEKETRAVMSYVAANQTLKGCPTKCSDPSILTSIFNRYNADRGVLTQQFGAERSIMKRIMRSVGGSDTECDVLFEENYETYDDALFPPTEQQTRIKAARIKMADAGGCKWAVAAGAGAIRDISGDAIGLMQPATNMTRFIRIAGDNEYINIRSIEVYGPDATGKEVRIRLPKEGITSSGFETYGGEWGVNENLTNFHSNTSANPWVEVDIGFEQNIQRIVVNNRTDTYKSRMKFFSLQLLNPTRKEVWSTPLTEDVRQEYRPTVVAAPMIGALAQPFSLPSCAVDCRAPANLAAVKAAAGAVASSANQSINFRQVTQSFRNGSAVCEYKVLKDVTVRDPYTKRSSTESDIDTYVSATFKLSPAAGCTYTLDTVQEFPPDDVESRMDTATGDEVYYLGSKQVTPPMLFSYDPDTAVSQLVNGTAVNM